MTLLLQTKSNIRIANKTKFCTYNNNKHYNNNNNNNNKDISKMPHAKVSTLIKRTIKYKMSERVNYK